MFRVILLPNLPNAPCDKRQNLASKNGNKFNNKYFYFPRANSRLRRYSQVLTSLREKGTSSEISKKPTGIIQNPNIGKKPKIPPMTNNNPKMVLRPGRTFLEPQ